MGLEYFFFRFFFFVEIFFKCHVHAFMYNIMLELLILIKRKHSRWYPCPSRGKKDINNILLTNVISHAITAAVVFHIVWHVMEYLQKHETER